VALYWIMEQSHQGNVEHSRALSQLHNGAESRGMLSTHVHSRLYNGAESQEWLNTRTHVHTQTHAGMRKHWQMQLCSPSNGHCGPRAGSDLHARTRGRAATSQQLISMHMRGGCRVESWKVLHVGFALQPSGPLIDWISVPDPRLGAP